MRRSLSMHLVTMRRDLSTRTKMSLAAV